VANNGVEESSQINPSKGGHHLHACSQIKVKPCWDKILLQIGIQWLLLFSS